MLLWVALGLATLILANATTTSHQPSPTKSASTSLASDFQDEKLISRRVGRKRKTTTTFTSPADSPSALVTPTINDTPTNGPVSELFQRVRRTTTTATTKQNPDTSYTRASSKRSTASSLSSSIETSLVTDTPSIPTSTPKPARKHRRRHGRKRSRQHHKSTFTTVDDTHNIAGSTSVSPGASNLASPDSEFAVTKTSATDQAATIKRIEQPQRHKAQPLPVEDFSRNYDDNDNVAPSLEEIPDGPELYAYSLSSSYSSKLGSEPEFSSSENFAFRPSEDYQNAENIANVKRNDRDVQSTAPPKRNCYVMHKPMPGYVYPNNKEAKISANHQGAMMTCYVCGQKDDPFSNGGYTEDCNISPTDTRNVHHSHNHQSQYADPYHGNQPLTSATNEKLYAGKGQTPYLSLSSKDQGSNRNHQGYDPYYDNYGYEETHPQATGYSHGSDKGYGKGNSGGGGGDDSNGNYAEGTETGKATCKIAYRGKTKCKICGDPKSDAVFSEECDYEKNDPGQHQSTSYDYGSADNKNYPRSGKGGSGGGHQYYGPGGYGSGGGGGGGDGYGNNNGYGNGGGYGGYSYPDYGGYGSGTGYDSNYDPYSSYYGVGPDDYPRGGGGGGGYDGYDDSPKTNSGGSHGSSESDKHKDKGSHDDGGKYSGSSQADDYVARQPQATAIHTSDKTDANDGRSCKVVFKDITSYSPYRKSDDNNSKPKMKCMVCTSKDGFGGVTEECSYNGGGELSSRGAFPDGKDIASFFGKSYDSFYPNENNRFRDSLFN